MVKIQPYNVTYLVSPLGKVQNLDKNHILVFKSITSLNEGTAPIPGEEVLF